MIKVKTKLTGLEKLGPAIQAHLKRTLPLETRLQILLEEAQPVAELMKAKAPRSATAPHAADAIAATVVRPEDTLTGTRNERAGQAIQLAASGATATVAIGVTNSVPHSYVLRFHEYGTRKMPARPFLRPTADAELPAMLKRVGERVAKALQS